jgi:anaerobic ribonucleoside-triphosphate reductase activating protein
MRNDKKIKILKRISASFLDYPDNISLAIIVYILGCTHNCINCQNPKLQDINIVDNTIISVTLDEFEDSITKLIFKYRTNKLVLSGGDPLHPDNIKFIREFLKFTKFDVCVYTGYPVEYVQASKLSNFKFLKCGKYISTLNQSSVKTDDYLQFSSKNQKLYNDNFQLVSKDGKYYFYGKEEMND